MLRYEARLILEISICMITIRKAVDDDVDFISRHAYRLLDFELPAWRANEKDEMTKADVRHIMKSMFSKGNEPQVFIALDSSGQRCGFIHLDMQRDYYTDELSAHIRDIVVIAEAEGKGIGKALLQKADEWAKQNKARWITLNVFEENKHAREVYEKTGYQVEWVRYLKVLS